MPAKLIYFVRHGESKLNALGIRQGPDGPLSEKGQAQAMETAKKFPKKRGKPEVIISSPYERARETAGIIGKELDMPVEYCDLLVERRNPTEIIGRSGKEKEVQYIVDKIDKSFHEDDLRYSDEENFLDLKDRARALLEYITHRQEKRIIMVTHHIFLKMVVAYMLYGEGLNASIYNTLSFYNPLNNAGLTIAEYITHWFNKKTEWKLIAWNNEG